MRMYLLTSFFLFLAHASFAQVQCSRTSPFVRGGYSVSGKVILEQLTDSTARLRLDDDFETDSGPDVVIFLSNDSTNINGALRVADIGTVNGLRHFKGAISFDLPTGVRIDDYRYVVMRCLLFNLHWATAPLPSSDCMQTSTPQMPCDSLAISFADSVGRSISLCVTDGVSDVIRFMNSGGISVGQNYAYVITDINGNIQNVLMTNSFNFEGIITGTSYVYGVGYEGDLSFTLDTPISSITATGCVRITPEEGRLTVVKTSCVGTFDCETTATATTNWVQEVSICPSDGQADVVPFVNSRGLEPGNNFVYLVTDTNNLYRFMVRASSFNFEGSSSEPNRVFGISYDGTLQAVAGQHIRDISSTGCWALSDTTLFLTVLKDACPPIVPYECSETTTATDGWISEVSICPTDGTSDRINLRNTGVDPPEHYAYIITDTNRVIQHIVRDTMYDFEGSGMGTQFVYGVSFDRELVAPIGGRLTDIRATGCAVLSNQNQFLTVFKTLCRDSSDTGRLRGKVLDIRDRPLANVDIMVNGVLRGSTNASGRFDIQELPLIGEYMLTARAKDNNVTNGLTSGDLITIQRHLLGVAPFESIFQSLAADVNNDGRVSVTDMVIIRNVILSNREGFPEGRNWLFVNGMGDYSNIQDLRDIPQTIIVRNLTAVTGELTFRAIKLGDANGSAQ